MERSDICGCIMRLYFYADATKVMHYTTESIHQHKLCDEVRETILDFTDDLAEKMFGIIGKPALEDFAPESQFERLTTIDEVCNKCLYLADGIREAIESDNVYSGIVSLIDDFKGKISQEKFLATFDRHVNFQIN